MLALVLLAVLSSPADPSTFVKSLYDADQRNVPNADPVYGVRTRESIGSIFDEPLASLIWRDLVDAMGEVGRMDGHYLYDAQDNEVKNIRVRTLENQGDTARVLATWAWPSDDGRAEFHLRKTANGWRIANIVYPQGDYKQYLETDFPEPEIVDERAAQAVCELYENYKITVPEGWDIESEAADIAEMFANGTGDVKQDFSAAIHVLCGDDDLDAEERWSMLEHVLKMERGLTDRPLAFCDHSTTHNAAIHCSAERSSDERATLEARFDAIPKTPALEQLRETADRFLGADAAWRAEEHRGGTMYSYAETEYRVTNEEEFVELLESGRAPAASEAEVKKLDAQLNAAYRKWMKSIEPCQSNCAPPLEPEILRGAQRAWIPYRDAWIRYYQERWKGAASPDALRREIAAKLMRARIAQFTRPE